jgi:DNA polymerase-3 subunit epsilon
VAVIDFETTGMSPAQGARATEIAAVLVREGRIVGRYQSLMYTGVPVTPFVEQLTGISNAMLRDAPPAEQVMAEVLDFTQGCPLVAHNAAFDRGFWLAEAQRTGRPPDPAHETLACTVLLSRRLYPDAPSHSLGRLAHWLGLERDGQAHRALSDAELTARLLLRLHTQVERQFAQHLGPRAVDHELLCLLQRTPRTRLGKVLASLAA